MILNYMKLFYMNLTKQILMLVYFILKIINFINYLITKNSSLTKNKFLIFWKTIFNHSKLKIFKSFN